MINGARAANPGEYTLRAFLNGKMDLSQAEAVVDVINSQTEKALKQSQLQLEGQLSKKINTYKDILLDMLAEIEANVDFHEEGIDPIVKDRIPGQSDSLIINIKKLISTFNEGHILKHGLTTAIIGRPNDTELVDITRTTRWLNEAQRIIAERVPALRPLMVDNTSLTTQDQLSYNLVDLTVGDETAVTMADTTVSVINRIFSIGYKDGANSQWLRYNHIDEWDKVVDPSSTDFPTGKPFRWTRRANAIELRPIADSGSQNVTLRVIGDRWPVDFTSNSSSVSELERADEGLIMFTEAKAWRAIGDEARHNIRMKQFSNANPASNEEFGWLEEYARRENELHSWDGDLYGDGIGGFGFEGNSW